MLQERLFRTEDLNLQKAIDYYRTGELSKVQEKSTRRDKAEINSLHKKVMPKSNTVRNKETTQKFDCRRCGIRHYLRECPVYKKKCKKCDKLNHFAIRCKIEKIKELTEQADVDSESKENSFCINNIEIKKNSPKWFEMVQTEKSTVKFKLDTGADVNVLPLSIYNKIKISKVKLKSTNVILESFGSNKINR